jgi:hypothetical protein
MTAAAYERIKTLLLGTTLKLDSTIIAFKNFVTDEELDQHVDQDFYYELDKLLFVYKCQIGEDRYSVLVDRHKGNMGDGSSLYIDEQHYVNSANMTTATQSETGTQTPDKMSISHKEEAKSRSLSPPLKVSASKTS